MNLILILNILKFWPIMANSIGINFNILKNQDINSTCKNSISALHKQAEIFCVASCYSNTECSSVVYNRKQGLLQNCFLYSQSLNSSELVRSSTSTLYQKKQLNGMITITTTFQKLHQRY